MNVASIPKRVKKRFLTSVLDRGERLDVVCGKALPQFSRSCLSRWISAGNVTINGFIAKPKYRISGGETVKINAEILPQLSWGPESIEINVIFQDAHVLVVDKPAGLVVHPGNGNPKSTLVNALLGYDKNLSVLPRAGLVHRLDKDTSGLLVVARSLNAYYSLVDQLKNRTMSREYFALVFGKTPDFGVIDSPIGRHMTTRTRMAVVPSGRRSVTRFKKIKSLKNFSLLDVSLETGRTHQIRVHLSSIGYPLVGDPVYKANKPATFQRKSSLTNLVNGFTRQALHAKKLVFEHPADKKNVVFENSLSDDIEKLMGSLADLYEF